MVRILIAPSTWEAGKWLAWTVLLLAPGSLVVLALWWAARASGGRALFPPARADERYLAEVSDLPDLERRMRTLERASGGPVFVTFNH